MNDKLTPLNGRHIRIYSMSMRELMDWYKTEETKYEYMKPKKNHKFCVACGRPKMLFETEAEAQAFIRFNSGDILIVSRKAPVRSYYCQLCGGYHVTSNPSKDDAVHMDERGKKMVEAVDILLKAKRKESPR